MLVAAEEHAAMAKPSFSSSDAHSESETERRREEALKRMLSTPHKPHTDKKPIPRKTKRKISKKP